MILTTRRLLELGPLMPHARRDGAELRRDRSEAYFWGVRSASSGVEACGPARLGRPSI